MVSAMPPPQAIPIFGPLTYADTVRHGAIKFGTVNNPGNGHVYRGQPRSPTQGAGPCTPNFGDSSLPVCLRPRRLTYQRGDPRS